MSRSKNWCWTLNNPSAAHVGSLRNLGERASRRDRAVSCMSYIIFQEEVGDAAGTRHLQGYFEFKTRMRLNQLRRWLNREAQITTMHLEVRRGTGAQARDYCNKDESRVAGGASFAWGRIKPDGRPKLDLAAVGEQVKEGIPMKQIAEEQTEQFIKHHYGLKALRAVTEVARREPPDVFIYYGPTGSGKSYRAMHEHGEDVYVVDWPLRNGIFWWNGYDGQEVVIFDEFRCQIKLTLLLRIIDGLPFKVQCKGGFSEMTSSKIVITTNVAPEKWYAGVDDARWAPLKRRIDDFCRIWEFTALTRLGGAVQVHSRERPLGPRGRAMEEVWQNRFSSAMQVYA